MIEIVDQQVVVEVVDQTVRIDIQTHDPDPAHRPPWTNGDMNEGRITWGVARNARWSNVFASS